MKKIKKPLTEITVRQLSDAFTTVIQEWLSTAELKQMRRRNHVFNMDSGVCASHDYCDANMAMEEAFKRVTGQNTAQLSRRDRSKEGCDRTCTCLSNTCLHMWTEAWHLSKSKGFKL